MGVLIRNAAALERAAALTTLVLDKTGTVTEGRLAVSEVVAAPGFTVTQVLSVAAALEQGSVHPLAQAIGRHAQSLDIALAPIGNFQSVPGRGARARLASGEMVAIGSPAFVAGLGVDMEPNADMEPDVDMEPNVHMRPNADMGSNVDVRPNADMEPDVDMASHIDSTAPRTVSAPIDEGATQVAVARDGRLLGWITLSDRLRQSSAAAIRRLRGQGLAVIMVTGDHAGAARAVARAAGIDDFRAGVLPAGKVDAIVELQGKGQVVGMVGDGVNDAPALAAADVGFAMGAGADIAVEAADVTVIRADLEAVADAILLARATVRKIRQNLFFAFAYNVLGIPLAAFGALSPVVAGAAMAASSVSVVGNALLLRRWRARGPHGGVGVKANPEETRWKQSH
jgi:Cu+-exporting ATPase